MRRHGFTLIELLVVIAIIGILIAPAAARRAGGPRGRPPDPVCQQPQADRPGDAQLPRRSGLAPLGVGPTSRSGLSFWGPLPLLGPYFEGQNVFNATNFSHLELIRVAEQDGPVAPDRALPLPLRPRPPCRRP